ncbi:MerR family transcriptional regulator [Microbulbifer sp. TYP-18]|uniref:MerR family transcriptional regulator n=1 Tax=Microbulbifer sp. TYP-18 TaxID=3230024 RepID=UPI0034C6333B
MKENERLFTLDELGSLVDLPRRTVRYYIQMGLVDRPEGAGRGAHYTTQHLDQLLEIRKWQQAGLSLDRIRELLSRRGEEVLTPPPRPRQKGSVEVWSHVVINDGVELIVDPKRANLTPEEVRELATGIMNLYEKTCSGKE